MRQLVLLVSGIAPDPDNGAIFIIMQQAMLLARISIIILLIIFVHRALQVDVIFLIIKAGIYSLSFLMGVEEFLCLEKETILRQYVLLQGRCRVRVK